MRTVSRCFDEVKVSVDRILYFAHTHTVKFPRATSRAQLALPAAAIGLSALLLSACGSTVDIASSGGSNVSAGDGTSLNGLDGLGQPIQTEQNTASSTTAPTSTSTTDTAATGDDTAVDSGSSAPTTAPTSASGPVAVRSTGPLTIGFLTTDTSNAAAAGASYGNKLSESNVTLSLVKAMNAKGGINGRQIKPILAKTDTGTANWNTDFNAACATFTQDNHVDAVLGYAFMFNEGFEKCLTDKKVVHLSTTEDGPDAPIFKKNRYFFSLMTPAIERRTMVKIDGGLASGILTAKNKIGVIMDSCPPTARTYPSMKAYAKSKGLTIAADQAVGCPTGAADASAAVTAMQNAFIRFRSAGVDTLLLHASSESAAALLGSLFAQQQGWHPTWLLSSIATTSVLQNNSTPKAQMAKMHVFGWQPSLDVAPNRYPALSSSAKRCLALLKTQGIQPTAAADYLYALNVCDAVFAYESALKVTLGSTDAASVARAVEATNKSHDSTTTVNGLSLLTPARHDAPSAYRVAGFTDSCSCFTYSGPIRSF